MKKKEIIVILVGFVLIFFTGIFTFIKPNFDFNKETNNNDIATEYEFVKTYPRITSNDLKNIINKKENITILDIREERDFNAEHIIDSINIPYSSIAQSDFVAKNKKIIIVAAETSIADKAAAIFEKKGASEIKVLRGGFSEWKDSQNQTINWGNPTSFVNQSKVTFLEQDDFKRILEEKKINIEIIDVRPETSFDEFIPGAKNVPLDELEKRRSEINTGKEIVVYGDTELEGFMAGVRLYDLNYFPCYVLRGGFELWKKNGLPITK